MAIDDAKLNAFMGNLVNNLGAVMHAATIVVGDQLGLYKALAEGPCTAAALASRTQTDARYLREWLSAQAASGYVQFGIQFHLHPRFARARGGPVPGRAGRRAAQTPFNLIFEARP